jgi:hypothetical protein
LGGAFWRGKGAAVHRINPTTFQFVEENFLTGFNSIISAAFDGPNTLYILEENFFGFAGYDGTNRLWRVDMTTRAKTLLDADISLATHITIDRGVSWSPFFSSSSALLLFPI